MGNPAAYNKIFNISVEMDISDKEYLNTIDAYFYAKIIHINIGISFVRVIDKYNKKFCNNVMKKDGFASKNKIDFLAIYYSTPSEKAKNAEISGSI